MDADKSNVLCPVSSLVVRDSFEVPSTFTQACEYFNEENLVQSFRESPIRQKSYFFTTYFRPDVSLKNQVFVVDTSLFNDEAELVISPMN